ncbi:hypothetical protein IW261DRAFT_1346800 [Armillaria novae-zelandiae]|uniref:Uncharacterized protein n=1 Tax=Armillaria novae-zelandiae TaxID=153914 RepID=A0AA39T5F2_9AGAR|nr:hypothetical protein IW261DRAFT_1346800 [Armillaria novae-zelandiae]
MQQRTPTPPPAPPSHSLSPPPPPPVPSTTRLTQPDEFSIYREYMDWPTHIPKSAHSTNPQSTTEHHPPHSVFGPGQHSSSHIWAPFANATTFHLLKWFYNSDKKTLEDLNRLVYDVLLQPDFSVHECEDFSAAREAWCLDKPDIFNSDVWKQDSVGISLSQKEFSWNTEAEAPVVKVESVWHCSLTKVITSTFQDSSASEFHLKGYKEMWKASEDSLAERIYGEVYTSLAYLKMEEKPTIPPDSAIENIVVPILLYTDSTHLANFGDASFLLWPGYLFIGLLSKLLVAMPDVHAAHHFVYMPEVSNLYIGIHNYGC